MSRLLVLGATGSLGRHVMRQALDARHEVTVFARTPSKLAPEDADRVLVHAGDLSSDLPDDVPHLWDSSAATITASGLWDLSEAVTDAHDSERYQQAALTILQTLCNDEFLPRARPEWEGILLHGIYHYHKGLGVDESVAWGDHFFVESLVKALAGRSDAAW